MVSIITWWKSRQPALAAHSDYLSHHTCVRAPPLVRTVYGPPGTVHVPMPRCRGAVRGWSGGVGGARSVSGRLLLITNFSQET